MPLFLNAWVTVTTQTQAMAGQTWAALQHLPHALRAASCIHARGEGAVASAFGMCTFLIPATGHLPYSNLVT